MECLKHPNKVGNVFSQKFSSFYASVKIPSSLPGQSYSPFSAVVFFVYFRSLIRTKMLNLKNFKKDIQLIVVAYTSVSLARTKSTDAYVLLCWLIEKHCDNWFVHVKLLNCWTSELCKVVLVLLYNFHLTIIQHIIK